MGTRIYPPRDFILLKGKLRWISNVFVYPKKLNILKEVESGFDLKEKKGNYINSSRSHPEYVT